MEHWEAPNGLLDAATIAQKRNTTHNIPLLVSGLAIRSENTVTAVVPSSMWDCLRSISASLRDQGRPPLGSSWSPNWPPLVDNGFIGDVSVIPYAVVGI